MPSPSVEVVTPTWALLSLALAQSSPHQDDLARNRHVAPYDFPSLGIVRGNGDTEPRVKRVVYGYYPYWVSAWEELRWDLLTHIAFFAIEMNSDGTLGSRHGWPDRDFVDTAHLFGVKADVTFTLFSGSGILTLCSSDTNRARGITNMVDAMEEGGADGINVDFEGLSRGTRDCFTQYIRELREELDRRGHTEAGIGIAGPAVDWTNEFDLAELSNYTDVFFIMGYGYHWTRSSKPGPTGQLRVTDSWRPHISISMQRTIAHYTALVPPERRAVIVFGVPYYGREWPTASSSMHSATTGNGASRTYAVARRATDGERTRLWDPDSQNAWYVFQSGGAWRHTWYDDEESLAAKYQLVLEQEIGGIGMWALGYDGEFDELWNVLDAYFTEEPTALAGTRAAPQRISLPFEVTADTREAPSNYFNVYACAPDTREYGREYVYSFSTCGAGRLDVEVEDGPGVDIDLHLLSGTTEDTCVARHDRTLTVDVAAGTHYIVADSFVSDHVPQEGEFTLRASFTPTEPGCRPNERCVDGRCIAQGVEPIANLSTRREADDPWLPPYEIGDADPDPEAKPPIDPAEDGCACTSHSRRRGGSLLVLLLLPLALLARRVHYDCDAATHTAEAARCRR